MADWLSLVACLQSLINSLYLCLAFTFHHAFIHDLLHIDIHSISPMMNLLMSFNTLVFRVVVVVLSSLGFGSPLPVFSYCLIYSISRHTKFKNL